MTRTPSTRERLGARVFRAVHRRNLVYNTCWEDPALDRVVLNLSASDRVVVITSAGCNALDYLLAGAGEVNAVDVNPIQNALLEFKAAAIRGLDFAGFWRLFGAGGCPDAPEMYLDAIRPRLSAAARRYWDRHVDFFDGKGIRKSFYYRGTSGLLARLVLAHARAWQRLRGPMEALLAARTVQEQRDVYETRVRHKLWTPALEWFLAQGTTLSLLGVPYPQRRQIDAQYPGGVVRFIRDALETVLTQLPFHDNYFWRVYLQGHYTRDCCPEYLKPANFERLKGGLLERLRIHTDTVAGFLDAAEPGVSKFVLLDHMDWLSHRHLPALADEWTAILQAAHPGARVIFRSAGLRVDFLDRLRVTHRGYLTDLGALLTFHPRLAADLHARDRVHTYGSFHVADLPGG